jgi:hypothetical protein
MKFRYPPKLYQSCNVLSQQHSIVTIIDAHTFDEM